MTQMAAPNPAARMTRPKARRIALAGCGVACVGVGGVGVFVPGLPTTIFLIIASWCFARSCPWLEDRLIRNRFFRPFLRYLEPGAAMPRRARVTSIIIMWTAIAISSTLIVTGDLGLVWIVPLLLAAGLAGTSCICRFRRSTAPI